MAFVKGKSGNPYGRPKGTTKIERLRALIEPEAPELFRVAVAAAKAGDSTMMRLILERVCPPLKADSMAVEVDIDLSGTPVDQGKAILQAATTGKLSIDDATRLLQGIAAQCRIQEITDLEARLDALEQSQPDNRR
jgi:hypothetical protein